jgi:poly-gamma-glutamate capsule biosynthesis protein CapA/YwtB (metallophosphatase superfamily)
MNIVIGADIVPTHSNETLFVKGRCEDLVGKEILDLLHKQDFCLLNLEVPLVNKASPIFKCGPALLASTDCINGLNGINPFFFCLANNHILDQGKEGLLSTMDTLRSAGVSFCGAGKNIAEARRPCIYEKNGEKLGVYCCAEHEFSIATEASCGANPYDPLESFDDVRKLKESVDYVVVLYHGGHEEYRYPSPELQRRCRKFVDSGADLVICQHTHCIGCKEDYLKGCIVYGQGNFLFDLQDNEYWDNSLLVSVSLSSAGNTITYVPIEKNGCGVKISDSKVSAKILNSFLQRSEEIKEPGFVQKRYNEFAKSLAIDYLGSISGKRYNSFLFRAANKITKGHLKKSIILKNYNKYSSLSALNSISCESHSELLAEILKSIK